MENRFDSDGSLRNLRKDISIKDAINAFGKISTSSKFACDLLGAFVPPYYHHCFPFHLLIYKLY